TAFLYGTARGIRHGTLHVGESCSVDRTEVDSVASVLGLFRGRLLYCSRAEHGDADSSASRGEFGGADIFPICSANGRAWVDAQSTGSIWADACTAGAGFQWRCIGAGGEPRRAVAARRKPLWKVRGDDCAILCCNSGAVLQP